MKKVQILVNAPRNGVLWWLRWRGPRKASLRKWHLSQQYGLGDQGGGGVGVDLPRWSYGMFRCQDVGKRWGTCTHEGQCDNAMAFLDFRGSRRTAEGGCRNWGVRGSNKFVRCPDIGFCSLHCLEGLLTLVEPKAVVHVKVHEMIDLATKELLTAWWTDGDSGRLGVGASLHGAHRGTRRTMPCSGGCAFLGRSFCLGVSCAFGKEVFVWERIIVWWLGLGQSKSIWTYFPISGPVGQLFELFLHLLGDIWDFYEAEEVIGGRKDIWLQTALEICGLFNTSGRTPGIQGPYKAKGMFLFFPKLLQRGQKDCLIVLFTVH